ncbi:MULTISPECIES: non-ribosomal peptide synthetase [unclassified Nodularia (in: cyanobacteria)]|uniref:non-ribosomal peptide synthetase n=1 Tax=unclassified Nodularia (in: cyanobacteria) TaxID=2656917 RepID=UPI001880CFAB|nr:MULTISPECIES: non-ribosomal peptide synthetase [unclassified Nodularia (in: cyanobacteria)]MBE9201694.1 amino acid adenylation domain-containing protein [Nodularia sp. LEGE 06071]MCC2691278.1 amino acid adenylation domain-containing protein [Nodularia sp. LEGE 04288]
MNDFDRRIAALSPEQRALLELHLKQKQGLKLPQKSVIPTRVKDDNPLASFAQQRMWFQHQMGHKSAISNNIPVSLEISGRLQVEVLERSIKAIIQLHQVLRTTLKTVNDRLVQVISPTVDFTLPLIDLRSLAPTEREAKKQQLIFAEACQPFDFSGNLFIRVTLLRLDETEYIMLMTMHHIVSDAWSIGVFFRDLNAFYQAFASNQFPSLAELPIQYADFAVWQREYVQGAILDQELAYWKQQLADAPTLLQLPTDRPRPLMHSFAGKKQFFMLSQTLTQSLRNLSQQTKTTLFMLLLAAFQTLLYRYTGQPDILIGSPVANRDRLETEELIGCLMNTVVFRNNLGDNPSFRELLTRVKETVLAAFAHQNLPFEKLVEELQLPRNLSHSVLFQVMFVLQNATSSRNIQLPDLDLHYSLVDNQTSQFDLTIHLVEEEFGLVGRLEYSTDLFDDSTITRLIAHFQTLLTSCAENCDRLISELPILTADERQQFLEWNQTATDYSQHACIHQLFEQQVTRTPDAVAVVCGEQQLTYAQLNQRANQLAHYLQKQGVKPEVLVGICVERSLSMVVGILGILKAGGVYVPLDPTYPLQRLAFVLSDAQVSVLLTQAHLLESLPQIESPIVCLDSDWQLIEKESQKNLATPVTPNNLAYVIYTSGSTGQPKGVEIAHQSLVNYTEAAIAHFEISQRDRILQFASISFDAAAEEIFPCLTQGATLILRTAQILSSVPVFLKTCHEWRLTVLDLPTAFWHQIVVELPNIDLSIPDSVRLVILGGEKVLPERLMIWQQQAPGVSLINTYGPTEATIVTTTCALSELQLTEISGRNLPIGKPIANTQTYILDPHLNQMPIGVPGELYIGGAGLARGYLNRPDLTDAAFIPNPFIPVPKARLYKTGDLVRYAIDGTIEFLGRIDRQVKIRGFRIEPEEIENLLTQHDDVQNAIVIAREERLGNKQLIAYVVPQPKHAIAIEDLRRFIESQLPKYMMPQTFVILADLPLTPNGKIDYLALPDPQLSRTSSATDVITPRTPTETLVAQIFSQVLEIDSVGINDDFFDLGGNSLLAIQLTTKLFQALDIELTVVEIFKNATVATLATSIDKMQILKQLSAAAVENLNEREELEI